MNNKILIGLIVLVIGAFAWVGLSGNNAADTVGSTHRNNLVGPQETSNESEEGEVKGDIVEAPNFSLERLGGGTISLSEYKDKKPVILDFFATWCPNCRRAMPKLNKWYEQYKDDVEVIGINLREDPKTVREYIEGENISFPITFDPEGVAANSYSVQYTNFHVLINKNGTIAGVIPGDLSESDVTSLISINQ